MRTIIWLLSFSIFNLSFAQDSIKYLIKTKEFEKIIQDNDIYEIKSKSFALKISVPLGTETIINLNCSLDSAVYRQYLKIDSVEALEAWGSGNAMAVSIKEYSTLNTTLILDKNSRQPYVHENNLFTSFNGIDTIGETLHLRLDYFNFMDDEKSFSKKRKEFTFKKLKGQTVFILMQVLVTDKNGLDYERVIPFKLKF